MTLRYMSPRVARRIERASLAVAVVSLGWVAIVSAEAMLFEQAARRSLAVAARAESDPPRVLRTGDVVGVLEIPRIGFSELVVEGDSDDMLRVAIGHLPDTPFPWAGGNSALAGHRDGHFRPLKDVRIGDVLRLQTRAETLAYRIGQTQIVLPTDLSVLAPTETRVLTLITCYPFSFIGKAPKRFVIRAVAAE